MTERVDCTLEHDADIVAVDEGHTDRVRPMQFDEFDEAVREASRVLKVNGRVIPATLQHVRLWAEREDGSESCGETLIASGVGACRRVWLDPEPNAHPDSVAAIHDADLVLLGPGSLFTSVLPHLAVGDGRSWPQRMVTT